jgi:hypothetical protein
MVNSCVLVVGGLMVNFSSAVLCRYSQSKGGFEEGVLKRWSARDTGGRYSLCDS